MVRIVFAASEASEQKNWICEVAVKKITSYKEEEKNPDGVLSTI